MGYMNADGKDEYMGDYRTGNTDKYILSVESDGETYVTGHETIAKCEEELKKYSSYNALLQVRVEGGLHGYSALCDWSGNIMPVTSNDEYFAWLATAKIA
jgi:hypothetical protein